MISEQINYSNDENYCGFYYDEQLNNELLCVTLHPSTQQTDNAENNFSKPVDGPKLHGDILKEYSSTPIARAIINSDFEVNIANTYSDFGNDALAQVWGSTVKPLQPYVDTVGKELAFLTQKIGEGVKSLGNTIFGESANSITSKFENFTNGIATKLSSGTAGDYMARNLILQGTMFKYWGGTGIDFGNLGMKYTVFSGYNKDGDFVSVTDEMEKLRFYVIGKFIPVDEAIIESGEAKSALDYVKAFASWQLPPGGYKSTIMNIDAKQHGTLCLMFGPYYAIPNLIIKSAIYHYSKVLIKNPSIKSDAGNNKENYLIPLYCDVTLILEPATKFSDKALFDFAHGRLTTEERKLVVEKLDSRLKDIKSRTSNTDNITKI